MMNWEFLHGPVWTAEAAQTPQLPAPFHQEYYLSTLAQPGAGVRSPTGRASQRSIWEVATTLWVTPPRVRAESLL